MKRRTSAPHNSRLIVVYAITIMLFTVLPYRSLHSQCWQWAVNSGGDTYEHPMGVSVDPLGRIAVTGEFQGTAIFGNDTLVSAVGRDVFTVLLDSSGAIQHAMGGIGDGSTNISNGVGSDATGNVYIAGNFSETITFDGTSLVSEGLLDIFLVKYDPSGSLLWAVRAGGSSNINANDLAVDQDGNCYLIGNFYNTATFGDIALQSSSAQDVFTVKYNSSGEVLWAASSGSLGSDNGHGIAVDASGNVYITGIFQSDFIFGDTAFSSVGNYDGFVAKFDPAGQALWARTGGGSNNEFFNKVVVDEAGSRVYVTGDFESDTMVQDDLVLVNTNEAGIRRDIFLLALDADGATQWGQSAGSPEHDFSVDVALDQNGDIYITGTFDKDISFDEEVLASGGRDLFVTKFSPEGQAQWALKPTVNTASGNTTSLTTFGIRPIITGEMTAGPAPPILVFDQVTLISNGSLDLFVARLGPPCSEVTTSSFQMQSGDNELIVYPNPFTDLLMIRLSEPSQQAMEVRLFNTLGSLIHVESDNGNGTIMLETGDLPAGLYFLQVGTGRNILVANVVKYYVDN